MQKVNLNLSEEITLYSDEDVAVSNSINFEFEQSNKLRGIRRKLSVFNGGQCSVTAENKHQAKRNYRIDIALINPQPFRQRHVAWKWLHSSLIILTLGIVVAYLGWQNDLMSSNLNIYFLTALVVFFSTALILMLMFMHKSYDRVWFKSQFGNIRVIELLNRYPNKNKFNAFINRFIGQIKQARKNKACTISQFLASELKQLRYLRDEMVITEEQYQFAKTIIFKHDSFKSA